MIRRVLSLLDLALLALMLLPAAAWHWLRGRRAQAQAALADLREAAGEALR